MELKDWIELTEEITRLIEKNSEKYHWDNYQYYVGENREYSVLISMEQIPKTSDKTQKKAIIKSVNITPKHGQGY